MTSLCGVQALSVSLAMLMHFCGCPLSRHGDVSISNANFDFEHWTAGFPVWDYAALFGAKIWKQTLVA